LVEASPELEPLQFTLKYQKLMSSLAYPAKLDIFNETCSLSSNVGVIAVWTRLLRDQLNRKIHQLFCKCNSIIKALVS
ncbi:hypothetical protein DD865_13225, partial [Staphylococcus pseudintermedius]